jgi:hypothetical protein
MKGKMVKIEPANKVQSYFLEWDAFSAHKTWLFLSFTSLIEMEWTKASFVGMDLSNIAQFLFLFLEKIFEEVFCVAYPALNWKEFPWSP